MNEQIDVLVVGAGPTGLTAAIEVARRGLRVRIVEKRSEPSTTSKALVVHARTLEQFDTLGIADDLVARGYTSPGIDFSASTERPMRADMHKLARITRFPYILIVPQAETEAALERRLQAEGIAVERRTDLTAFVEREDGIEATIQPEGAPPQTVTARYLVGADGPHSVVRTALGIPFEGSKYEWTAFLGDVMMEGHEAEGGTEQHSSDRGLAFIVPFRDGSHRIVTIDERYQGGPMRSELSLDELQESISAILGKPIRLSRPTWLTRWGADLKIAQTYGRGRVFLAGDAAHTHSPAGGQGLNTGVQDAFGLGWRVARAVRGEGDAHLEAWRRERYAQGKRVLFMSDLLLRSLLLRKPLARRLREAVFDALVPLPPVQRTLAMNLSGLGIRYGKAGGAAGARVPDLSLVDGDHRVIRLYERLRGTAPVLLVYVEAGIAEAQRSSIEGIVAAAAAREVESIVVLRSGVAERHRFARALTAVDYRGDFERQLGATHPRLLLVRPDGYAALDLGSLDQHAVVEAYDRWNTSGENLAVKRSVRPDYPRWTRWLSSNWRGSALRASPRRSGSSKSATRYDSSSNG